MSRQRPLLPPGIGDDAALAAGVDRLRLVRALQETVAPRIIATGVFAGDDPWTDALSALAEHDPQDRHAATALQQFFTQPGVNRRLPLPRPDEPQNDDWASDIAASRAFHWGDAGFVLGLAVGMLLGPDAFGRDGGAR